MRRVTGPDGREWEVDVHWTGRPGKARRLPRVHAYWARRAERKAARKKRKEDDPPRWYDALDVIDFDLDGLIAVAIIVAIVVFVIFGAPILYLLAFDLLEILLLPVVAAGVVAWRTLRGTGFSLSASCGGHEQQRWNVVGVRQARAMERAIAEAVIAGGDVTTLFLHEKVDRVDE